MRRAVLIVLTLSLVGCSRRSEKRQRATPKPAPEAQLDEPVRASEPPSSLERALTSVPASARYLIFGGGSEPLSNQISLAQDVAMMGSLLDGQGLTLFASGKGAQVSVDLPSDRRAGLPDVRVELAKLFGVPGAETTRYEPARVTADGPATAEQVLHALERAIAPQPEPLLVFGATHGERGNEPRENSISLWGGWPLTVADLAQVLDRTPDARPTRFVITSCYGGGFAELAFREAEPRRGVRAPDTCGLFAAPWDDEASGCDPNPDRRAQESYSIHFLHALSGKDRHGKDRLSDIDIDGDRAVSLLEAHTFARTQARSFDVPTTTSERFLRSVTREKDRAQLDPLTAPEEVAVGQKLGTELELDDEAKARAQLRELDRILVDARELVREAQDGEEDSFHALRIALLERFPLLEHPWEKRTQALIDQESKALLYWLTDSELAEAHEQAVRELDEAIVQEDGVRVARARVLRLVRAFETLRLASALKKQGGKSYEHYRALRRCEAFVPKLRLESAPKR